MLRGPLEGLLNFIRFQINNATAEGFKSVIQLIKTPVASEISKVTESEFCFILESWN